MVKNSSKKSKTSKTKRAGLFLPIHHVRRQMRSYLGEKVRVQKGAAEVLAALTEYIVTRTLAISADRITHEGKHIHASHIFSAINNKDGEVRNVFPRHATGLFA